MVVLNIRGLAFMEIIFINSEDKGRQKMKSERRRRRWRRKRRGEGAEDKRRRGKYNN